jgi:Flp pilus assembly protein TadG
VFAPQIIQSLWRSTDGSALVEATVLTPVLIFLFFGVFEVSWYFYNQQLAEIGVRDAARYLARGPYITNFISEGTDPCQNLINVAAAKNLAVTGTTDGSGSVRVKGWTTATVSINCAPFDNSSRAYEGPPTIYRVTVSTFFADPALGYLGLLGLSTKHIRASHTERSFGTG